MSRVEGSADGSVEVQIVEQTFVRKSPIMSLRVRGQEIRTTAEHPFYVEGKGWISAREITPGDRLSSHDGQWVTVEAVTDLNEVATVYNLRVSDYHTYFVGSREWGFSVWAHNALCAEAVERWIRTQLGSRTLTSAESAQISRIAAEIAAHPNPTAEVFGNLLRNVPGLGSTSAQLGRTLTELNAAHTAFINQVRSGRVLLVSEGEFGFANSLVGQGVNPASIVATTTAEAASLPAGAQALQRTGATVVSNVRVTAEGFQGLQGSLGRFDTIVFNFPHTGSNLVPGNQALLRDFLSSASSRINPNGRVYITLRDTPYYRGWRLPQQAEASGFRVVQEAPFTNAGFPGYNPVTTSGAAFPSEPYVTYTLERIAR